MIFLSFTILVTTKVRNPLNNVVIKSSDLLRLYKWNIMIVTALQALYQSQPQSCFWFQKEQLQ